MSRFESYLRVVAVACLWLFLDASGQAFGCSCVQVAGSPCALPSGDVVLVGTLSGARDVEEAGRSGRQFVFRVEEQFRGVDGALVEVFSDKSSCGADFVPIVLTGTDAGARHQVYDSECGAAESIQRRRSSRDGPQQDTG